jgi:hypothetical protein
VSESGENVAQQNSIRIGKTYFSIKDLKVKKEFDNAKFKTILEDQTIFRDVVYQTNPPNWIYTVEIMKDVNREGIYTGKHTVNITRWRRRIEETTGRKKYAPRYWRFAKSYNIRSKEEWLKTSSTVNAILGSAKKTDASSLLTSADLKELAATIEQKKDLEVQLQELKKRYSKRRLEKAFYKDRYLEFKSNIGQYKQFLQGFKELLDSSETELHDYIKKNKAFWLFGPEYTDIKSKFDVMTEDGKRKAYQFDLLLERLDLFSDIVELKGPDVNLFDQRTSRRFKPNKELSEAISQVVKYLYICDTYQKNIFKPKGIVVIGNIKTDHPQERRLLESYLSNIEIITYSDLYDRGMAFVNYIQNPNRNFSEK